MVAQLQPNCFFCDAEPAANLIDIPDVACAFCPSNTKPHKIRDHLNYASMRCCDDCLNNLKPKIKANIAQLYVSLELCRQIAESK